MWDRASGKQRKTRFQSSATAARNARYDLELTLRSGLLPASNTMRLTGGIEAFLAAAEKGTALNKHGRKYKATAVRDLRGALEGHVKPALGVRRLDDVHRGDFQRLVDTLTPEKSPVAAFAPSSMRFTPSTRGRRTGNWSTTTRLLGFGFLR